MPNSHRQFSFAAGEIAPALYARSDQVRYATGLRTCRNFLVKKTGGVDNRPGTTLVGEVGQRDVRVRLIPFEFNADQTYVLEFGDNLMRVIRNGVYVVEATASLVDIDVVSNRFEVEYSGSDIFQDGDCVYLSSLTEATQCKARLQARQFRVADLNTGTNKFNLKHMDGTTYVDATGFPSEAVTGTINLVFETIDTGVPTAPYDDDHIFDLQHVQVADVMRITHPLYAPRKLTRTGHAAWEFDFIEFDGQLFGHEETRRGTAKFTKVTSVAADDLAASPTFSRYVRSSGSWVTDGAESGQEAMFGGFAAAANNARRPIATVSTSNLDVIDAADVIVTEAAEAGQFAYIWGNKRVSGSVAGDATQKEYRYRVCAVDPDTGEESQPIFHETPISITGITNANPAVVTCSAGHPFETGDDVFISGGMVGMGGAGPLGAGTVTSFLAYRTFKITKTSSTAFSLDGIDSTSWTAWSSGGKVGREYFVLRQCAAISSSNFITLSWFRPAHSGRFNIYRSDSDFVTPHNGLYGFIATVDSNVGSSSGLVTFKDIGLTPDYEITNPMATYQFVNKDGEGYPAACGLYQQRFLLGGLLADPEAVYASKVGALDAFAPSEGLEDDSPVAFKVFGRTVNQVRYLMDVGELVAFTDGGEWAAHGSANGVLTPTNINARQHSYNGSRGFDYPLATEPVTLQPIVVDSALIYAQEAGEIIRDILFNQDIDGYDGDDLTIFASHLLEGHRLRAWAYQQHPNSILWMVRDDGVLLGLTYIRRHQVLAWHRHDTDGEVESICVVNESGLDAVYMTVKRVIGGTNIRYAERMANRDFEDEDELSDAVFVDSAVTFDGTNTVGSSTLTISGGTTWDVGESLTLTSNDGRFLLPSGSGDEGNAFDITGADGTVVRFTIVNQVSQFVCSGLVNRLVPVAMRNAALSTWARATNDIGQLWHLEGKSVSVFADGSVVANPNDADYTVLTVTNGAITLPALYVKGVIGLPYTSDLQTLDLDTSEGFSLANKKKRIDKVLAHLHKTRGGYYAAGDAEPTTDAVNARFTDIASRTGEPFGAAPALISRSVDINVRGEWTTGGRVFIRQSDPLPMTVLSLVPQGHIPDGR